MDRIGEPVGHRGPAARPPCAGWATSRSVQRSCIPRPTGATIDITVQLRAADRVRHIFVQGNWPLRQDEILRRLTLRPGPGPAPARARRGTPGSSRSGRASSSSCATRATWRPRWPSGSRPAAPPPAPVNLVIDIDHGPGYPIGAISVEGNKALTAQEIAEGFRHLDSRFLWTRPLPFRLSLLREDRNKLTERYRDLGYAGARVTVDFDPAGHRLPAAQRAAAGRRARAQAGRGPLRGEPALRRRRPARGHHHLLARVLRQRRDPGQRGGHRPALPQQGPPLRQGRLAQRRLGARRPPHLVRHQRRAQPQGAGGRASRASGPSPAGRLADVVTAQEFPPLGRIGIGEGRLRQLPAARARRRAADRLLQGGRVPRRPRPLPGGAPARSLAAARTGGGQRPGLGQRRRPARALLHRGGPAGGHRAGRLRDRSGRAPALRAGLPAGIDRRQGGGALPRPR